MRNKVLSILGLILLGASISMAQSTPANPPVTQPFSVQTSAITLPGGHGKTNNSIVGTDSGITFTPSTNLDLFDRNLLSSDGSLKYFAGGVNYRLPALSLGANNKASNVNFLRVQFYLIGSFGVAQVNAVNHYGYTAGAGANYMLNNSGSWTSGGSGEYAHFPGYPGKSIVKLEIKYHF